MPGQGSVTVNTSGAINWDATAQKQLDFWVTTTPGDGKGDSGGSGHGTGTPAVPVVAPLYKQYADAVGHAPPLPAYAALFWQCRLRCKILSLFFRFQLPTRTIVLCFLTTLTIWMIVCGGDVNIKSNGCRPDAADHGRYRPWLQPTVTINSVIMSKSFAFTFKLNKRIDEHSMHFRTSSCCFIRLFACQL